MFMPSSSKSMQRGCQISCCQMIMEIFFSSGERSLRIWIFFFFLQSRQGRISERGAASDTTIVLFSDVSVYPTSVMIISLRGSEPMHHSTFEQIYRFTEAWVLGKPAFFCHFFSGRKRQDLLQTPRPPHILASKPWQWMSVVCQITGEVMIMWKKIKM